MKNPHTCTLYELQCNIQESNERKIYIKSAGFTMQKHFNI